MEIFVTIGTLIQTLGVPVAMLIALFVLVMKIQNDSNDTNKRDDAIINKQLDISAKNTAILDNQANLMVELNKQAIRHEDLTIEVSKKMDAHQKELTTDIGDLKGHVTGILPSINRMELTLQQQNVDFTELREVVTQLRDDLKQSLDLFNKILLIISKESNDENTNPIGDDTGVLAIIPATDNA
jgi:hypothetical protein